MVRLYRNPRTKTQFILKLEKSNLYCIIMKTKNETKENQKMMIEISLEMKNGNSLLFPFGTWLQHALYLSNLLTFVVSLQFLLSSLCTFSSKFVDCLFIIALCPSFKIASIPPKVSQRPYGLSHVPFFTLMEVFFFFFQPMSARTPLTAQKIPTNQPSTIHINPLVYSFLVFHMNKVFSIYYFFMQPNIHVSQSHYLFFLFIFIFFLFVILSIPKLCTSHSLPFGSKQKVGLEIFLQFNIHELVKQDLYVFKCHGCQDCSQKVFINIIKYLIFNRNIFNTYLFVIML